MPSPCAFQCWRRMANLKNSWSTSVITLLWRLLSNWSTLTYPGSASISFYNPCVRLSLLFGTPSKMLPWRTSRISLRASGSILSTSDTLLWNMWVIRNYPCCLNLEPPWFITFGLTPISVCWAEQNGPIIGHNPRQEAAGSTPSLWFNQWCTTEQTEAKSPSPSQPLWGGIRWGIRGETRSAAGPFSSEESVQWGSHWGWWWWIRWGLNWIQSLSVSSPWTEITCCIFFYWSSVGSQCTGFNWLLTCLQMFAHIFSCGKSFVFIWIWNSRLKWFCVRSHFHSNDSLSFPSYLRELERLLSLTTASSDGSRQDLLSSRHPTWWGSSPFKIASAWSIHSRPAQWQILRLTFMILLLFAWVPYV